TGSCARKPAATGSTCRAAGTVRAHRGRDAAMKPMLGDIELPQVQQVTTLDRRALAPPPAPGPDGSVLQDLGRPATPVRVVGVATGPQADDLARRLDGALRDGSPLAFVADITADARLERVVVADLSLAELAGRPDRVAYRLTLREFTEPPAPPDRSALDAG